jgi:ABC-2 type transport system ATP-binding protein
MLEIKIIKKAFGSKVVLEGATISIHENGIYGCIGKNGEGKTTFFKCINNLVDFEGNVLKNKFPIKQNQIAFIPTEVPIYNELTALEFVDFYKQLLNLKGDSNKPLFDVAQDRLTKEFSTGMRKKAFLNAVLQKKYEIYIFDEPFNGLDLESNYLLMNYIREIAKESIVFISSHILELLYKDCDMIFLIKNTKITAFEKQNFFEIEKELFENK